MLKFEKKKKTQNILLLKSTILSQQKMYVSTLVKSFTTLYLKQSVNDCLSDTEGEGNMFCSVT